MRNIQSLGLFTDLYQITMAYGYWKEGMQDHEATFHLTFRDAPFGGTFAVACGLHAVIEYLQQLAFSRDDLVYLSRLSGNEGSPLFEPAFLDYLFNLEFTCTLHAAPEGTLVFAHEPLIRVQGPIIQCQLIESALLNFVGYQSLIATKAARICLAAKGEPVLEFGMRRAHGWDGALTASRAAYIGGCAATSHLLAGKVYGIPVKGTHAHSWVMAFDHELEAFLAFAKTQPHNCVFVVDTYDSVQGILHAIMIGQQLREAGFDMVGIRLDSGDLEGLSKKARAMLNEAGFAEADILASNDLDEHKIAALKAKGAMINVWGVGTRLVTAHGQSSLNCVYKLSAIRGPGEPWRPTLKVSDDPGKTSLPGILQVKRYMKDGIFLGDILFDERLMADPDMAALPEAVAHNPSDLVGQNLLQMVFDNGKLVFLVRDIHQKRSFARQSLQAMDPAHLRLTQPKSYPVGIDPQLKALVDQLVAAREPKV